MCRQAFFDSPHDDLCARCKVELVQDIVDMGLDGSFGHHQRIGDLVTLLITPPRLNP